MWRHRRLARATERLVEAPDWTVARRLVRRRAAVLLTGAAETLLAEWADAARTEQLWDEAAIYDVHRVLLRRCRETDIDTAFAEVGDATSPAWTDRFDKVHRLTTDANAALTRYWSSGGEADLDRALTTFEAAADVAAATPHRPVVLSGLGQALLGRHALEGERPVLERAVRLAAEAVAATGPAAEERIGFLSNYGQALLRAAETVGDDSFLDRALTALDEAAFRVGDDTPELRAAVLTNLASGLLSRFERTGTGLADLERAVRLMGLAVESTDDDRLRSERLGNLGVVLAEHARQTDDGPERDRAIELLAAATRAMPSPSRSLPTALSNLAGALAERHLRTACRDDLDAALDAARRAVEATPPDAPNGATRLADLGALFRENYLYSGDLAYLDQAIDAHEAAVLRPVPAADLAHCLDQLAATLRIRGARSGDGRDLRRAVDVYARCVEVGRGTGRPVWLNNYAGSLRAEYRHSRDPAALDRAVSAYREAITLLRPGTPEHATARLNLARGLRDRAVSRDHAPDGDEAVNLVREVLDRMPADWPEREDALSALAEVLRARAGRTGTRSDSDAAVSAYRASCVSPARSRQNRLLTACGWVDWATERGAWSEVAEAYRAADGAFERLLREQAMRPYQEAWLATATRLPAAGARALIAVADADAAVMALERGRARLLSDALDRARIDLHALHTAAPALAARYRAAAGRLAEQP